MYRILGTLVLGTCLSTGAKVATQKVAPKLPLNSSAIKSTSKIPQKPENNKAVKANPIVAKFKDGRTVRLKDLSMVAPDLSSLLTDPNRYKAALDAYINHKISADFLAKQPMSRADAMRLKQFIYQFQAGAFMRSNAEKLIKDTDVEKIYKEQYAQKSEAKASHILFAADAKKSVVQHTEIQDKAKKVLKDIQDGKMTFEEAAKEHSTCPSGKKGGDLGFFTKDKMVKPFADKVFSMKKGETAADLVKTGFGYHIIKKTDEKTESLTLDDKLKQKIRSDLMRSYLSQLFAKKASETSVEKFDATGKPLGQEKKSPSNKSK
jgi:parvulin-like peptidyl-prolyl isomerase